MPRWRRWREQTSNQREAQATTRCCRWHRSCSASTTTPRPKAARSTQTEEERAVFSLRMNSDMVFRACLHSVRSAMHTNKRTRSGPGGT
ncbi:MAG: hypothetical protein DWH97_10905 [Planctomycetota bacterium]|nr:MAG: hypothetical protein DWH97_10905 [Planctomycetota bacterium]